MVFQARINGIAASVFLRIQLRCVHPAVIPTERRTDCWHQVESVSNNLKPVNPKGHRLHGASARARNEAHTWFVQLEGPKVEWY